MKQKKIIISISTMLIMFVMPIITYGASDSQILSVLTENEKYFTQRSFLNDAVRQIGWVLIKIFEAITNAVNGVLEDIIGMFSFTNSPEVQAVIDSFFPVFMVILTLTFMFLGYQYIFGHNENKLGIFNNVIIVILVFTCMPVFMNQMTNLTVAGVNMVQTTYQTDRNKISTGIVGANIVDLKYLDEQAGSDINSFGAIVRDSSVGSGARGNNLSEDIISKIKINEVVNPEERKLKNSDLFESYIDISAFGTASIENIDYGGLLDFFPEFYYRYHVNWFTIIMTLFATTIVLLFTCYKIGRIIIELAVNHFLVYLFAATDLTGGQRIKEILKSIVALCTVVFLTTIMLKFFFVFLSWLNIQDIGGVSKTLMIIFAALLVIDAPNIVERIIGVDAGVKSGFHVLVGAMGFGRGASAAVRGVRDIAIGNPLTRPRRDGETKMGGIVGGVSRLGESLNSKTSNNKTNNATEKAAKGKEQFQSQGASGAKESNKESKDPAGMAGLNSKNSKENMDKSNLNSQPSKASMDDNKRPLDIDGKSKSPLEKNIDGQPTKKSGLKYLGKGKWEGDDDNVDGKHIDDNGKENLASGNYHDENHPQSKASHDKERNDFTSVKNVDKTNLEGEGSGKSKADKKAAIKSDSIKQATSKPTNQIKDKVSISDGSRNIDSGTIGTAAGASHDKERNDFASVKNDDKTNIAGKGNGGSKADNKATIKSDSIKQTTSKPADQIKDKVSISDMNKTDTGNSTKPISGGKTKSPSQVSRSKKNKEDNKK